MAKLLVFHGHTMNSAVMRDHMPLLASGLARHADLVFVEAPHPCSEETVGRLYDLWRVPRLPPPHLTWWDATDDGREYRGWDASRARIAEHMRDDVAGVFGFSQGANVAAAVAALSEHGELPPLRFAVLVAGRRPRADVLLPYLARPLGIPSLHVWGTNDPFATDVSLELAESFAPSGREVWTWAGDHRVPSDDAAVETITSFVARHV